MHKMKPCMIEGPSSFIGMSKVRGVCHFGDNMVLSCDQLGGLYLSKVSDDVIKEDKFFDNLDKIQVMDKNETFLH